MGASGRYRTPFLDYGRGECLGAEWDERSEALSCTKDQIRAFFPASGSWTNHHRMAFAPTFKDQIEVHRDRAWLYLECHDVDLATGLMGHPPVPLRHAAQE